MSSSLWIVLAAASAGVLCYVFCRYVLVLNSREIDKQIDYSRMRPWHGDEERPSGSP